LWYADLESASLQSASLQSANLQSANLRYADLQYADLRNANLQYADLRSADLRYADLRNANLPSPTIVLLAHWGDVSKQLCADLMEYDAWVHGDREAFNVWAIQGACPYSNHSEQRAANFKESKEVWVEQIGKLCSPRDLMLRLFQEKDIKW
jgi:hypothetical protein